MKTILRTFVGCTAILFGTACMGAVKYVPENMKVELSLKVPGNNAVNYKLHPDKLENSYFDYEWRSDNKLPITVFHKVEERDSCMRLTVQLTAAQDVYFNYRQLLSTGYRHDNCQFYMPGFWYRRNLRSPKKAPSFHTSDSWLVREDRLSAPLTGIFSEKEKRFMTVNRLDDFSDFIQNTWEHCYDTYAPKPVENSYSIADMKQVLSCFFVNSLVDNQPLVYNSGIHLKVSDCERNGQAEVGFIGRVLLNAFNAWEYGWQSNRKELKVNSTKIFDSYLKNGFTQAGFFKESVNFDKGYEEPIHSIRRQSEGVYAMFHFLAYEKENGRRHPEWEQKLKRILDMFLQLQNVDGSFPRKFRDDLTIVDPSGGSTPSATLPLVMGYKYFKDKRYLASSKRTADYLEKELISKADYFSSTLDANCEDKEASLYAATATYYLSLITKGEEHRHYADLTKKAAYFALSWYYLWDVPFAPGQMLGDIGLKTRGWGNVSVENNHIDVFVFEFASVLQWLSKEYAEPRMADFAEVISTSMRQLLPYEGHLCGIAKSGFYPEVVQHTNWDYGKNGKGYYNDIFAPGWTVASLWELLTPGRAERFLLD